MSERQDIEQAAFENCKCYSDDQTYESFIDGVQWYKEYLLNKAIDGIVIPAAMGFLSIEIASFEKNKIRSGIGKRVKIVIIENNE